MTPAGGPSAVDTDDEQQRVTRQLDHIVQSWLPGWLGHPFDHTIIDLPTGRDALPGQPTFLRLGDALPDTRNHVPRDRAVRRGSHLAIDTDARDPLVAHGCGASCCAARPHCPTAACVLAGRSGAGKMNLLLILLYALASRYSPDELGMYLLDFKEGVSFVEFTPTPADPSWVPHARTVGIESDREYRLALLRALSREINRRAASSRPPV